MSVPEATGSGASPGLYQSVLSFWSVLIAILYTRLDLVTAELEDEGVRLAKLVVSSLISLLCLHTAFFFAMLFLLALFWDTQYRLGVLGGIFGIYFVIGISLLLVARNTILSRPKFLSQTLAELRRDAEGLRHAAATKKDEVGP
jgi:uncharacterized membrane protein YqjE